MLFFLTLLVGAVQFLLGLLRVGKIINYVSHAVIVGFTAGAGIIIALGQLDQLVGFKLPAGYHPLYEKTYLVLASLDRTNLYALGLALLAVAITVFGKKLHKNIPGALLGIVAGAVLAKAFGLADPGGQADRRDTKPAPGLPAAGLLRPFPGSSGFSTVPWPSPSSASWRRSRSPRPSRSPRAKRSIRTPSSAAKASRT